MFFQLVMTLTALYFGMLFSNWGSPQTSEDETVFSEYATLSTWILAVSQWITIALFTVSVTLYCCDKDRII